jgi:DNA-binding HxlR family transcriptional regulator
MHTLTTPPPPAFDVLSPQCPSRTVLRHVTDRWTPLIVSALEEGPLRFGRLRERVGGITPKVLTETLRSLERDGLVLRTVGPTSPPRVDYELTELGATLAGPIQTLRSWAQEHAAAVLSARDRYDAQ